ncbi:polyprenyl synthetase family protein [Anaerosinus massiliensis]|uniref:polyprenyl synthetase family protein n=1 Tax=Massilibacillus massiliensis TaxID=1806837 RepID=UPI000A9006F2|nr:farnesyl diphosphate synthase [Massilibacillus massiliensis]
MLKKYCNEKMKLIEAELDEIFHLTEEPITSILYESMRYSITAGGKRLRPILLLAAAEAIGKDGNQYLKVACALEMIHTYSLIHDDLPAMDNDDYRRGKLTNHKIYGEAMAILAGDALLTKAFEVIANQKNVDAVNLIKVISEISQAAGPDGMVGGQALDLLSENKKIPADVLRLMHQAKTGALFKTAIRAGAILADATERQLAALTQYAENFGLAFQITDDILDVVGAEEKIGKPVGSDERNHKSTYVSLYSLERAQEMAANAVNEALQALDIFGEEAAFLREVVQYLIARDC